MNKKGKGICRKTKKMVTIDVLYMLEEGLERGVYNKGRIDYCPNGGCNSCPIYNDMENTINE